MTTLSCVPLRTNVSFDEGLLVSGDRFEDVGLSEGVITLEEFVVFPTVVVVILHNGVWKVQYKSHVLLKT